MTTSATATTERIIATGLFTARGVDHHGAAVDRVVFPGGTLTIRRPWLAFTLADRFYRP